MKSTWIIALAAITGTAAHGEVKQKVLGKLAQTLDVASIRRSPSNRAHVYYRAKPYEYIIVRAGKSKTWLEVVMDRGIIAYVPASSVARLPFEVTMDAVDTSRSSRSAPTYNLTSRGEIANQAMKYKGTPYKWGGNDLYNGIDCSGFVKKLYGMIGLNLPRTAAEQALVGTAITRLEELVPGDRLYFWDKKRGKIGHTGMYTGNGFFVHSSVGNRGVDQDYLTERWRKILVCARR